MARARTTLIDRITLFLETRQTDATAREIAEGIQSTAFKPSLATVRACLSKNTPGKLERTKRGRYRRAQQIDQKEASKPAVAVALTSAPLIKWQSQNNDRVQFTTVESRTGGRSAHSTGIKPNVLDLFAGAGGLSLGFAQAGYRIIGGIDNSVPSIETFKANLSGSLGLVRDLRENDFSDIEDLVGPAGVDLIIGGASCQGFSTSGGLSRKTGRDQGDPRNRLFLNYVDLVDLLRPSWIVFENVPGLLLYNQGRVALEIVQAFREIGYSVAPMILLAADFGVPQLRRRLVFIGNRTGADIPFPAATNGNSDLWSNYALPFAHLSRIGHGAVEGLAPHVNFNEACGDLPPVDEGSEIDGEAYPGAPTTLYQAEMRRNSVVVRQHAAASLATLDRLAAKTLKQGQNWRSLPSNCLPDRFKRIRPYDATTLLKRLRSDLPAYTITTKFNEATTGAFIHPQQPRTLTLREAARLQAFPDDFIFAGTHAQIRHQIGNAVPVLLAQAVGEAMYPAVAKDLAGRTSPPLRDVVLVESNLAATDILKLRAPRTNRPVPEPALQLS